MAIVKRKVKMYSDKKAYCLKKSEYTKEYTVKIKLE